MTTRDVGKLSGLSELLARVLLHEDLSELDNDLAMDASFQDLKRKARDIASAINNLRFDDRDSTFLKIMKSPAEHAAYRDEVRGKIETVTSTAAKLQEETHEDSGLVALKKFMRSCRELYQSFANRLDEAVIRDWLEWQRKKYEPFEGKGDDELPGSITRQWLNQRLSLVRTALSKLPEKSEEPEPPITPSEFRFNNR